MKGPSKVGKCSYIDVIRPCLSWACKACSESSRYDHQSQETYIQIPALLLPICWSWDKFLSSLYFGFPLLRMVQFPPLLQKGVDATLIFGNCIKESSRVISSNVVLPWRHPHQQVLALTWRLQCPGQSPWWWLVGEMAVHFFMQTQPHILTTEVFEVASSIKHRWKNKPLAGVWPLPRHPTTPMVSALHYHRGKPTPWWHNLRSRLCFLRAPGVQTRLAPNLVSGFASALGKWEVMGFVI